MEGFLALPEDIQRKIFTRAEVPLATIKAVSKGWLRAGRLICRRLTLTGREEVPSEGQKDLLKGLEDCAHLYILRTAFRSKTLRMLTIKKILQAGRYEVVVISACSESSKLLSELHHLLDTTRLQHLHFIGSLGIKLACPRVNTASAVMSLDLSGLTLNGSQLNLKALAATFPQLKYLGVAVTGSIVWSDLSSFSVLVALEVTVVTGTRDTEDGLLQAVGKSGVIDLSIQGSAGRFCSFTEAALEELLDRPQGFGHRFDVRSLDVSFGLLLSDALMGSRRLPFLYGDPFHVLVSLTLPMGFLHGEERVGRHDLRLDSLDALAQCLGKRRRLEALFLLFGGCENIMCARGRALKPFVKHSGATTITTNSLFISSEWLDGITRIKDCSLDEAEKRAVETFEKESQEVIDLAKAVGCALHFRQSI